VRRPMHFPFFSRVERRATAFLAGLLVLSGSVVGGTISSQSTASATELPPLSAPAGNQQDAALPLRRIATALPPGGLSVSRTGAQDATSASTAVEKSFRNAFGFNTDPSWVAGVDAAYPVSQYGVALTPTETADMDHRLAVQRAAQPVSDYVRGNGAADFGGMWFDQLRGGVLVVSFTANTVHHRDELLKVFPHPNDLDVVTVPRHHADLERVQTQLAKDHGQLRAEGFPIPISSIDVKNNVVRVETTGDNSSLQSLLDKTYGIGITQVVTSTSAPFTTSYTRSSAPPLYGGQQIAYPSDPVTEDECSTAFAVRQNSTGKTMVLTAGHCPAEAQSQGASWYVGYGSYNCYWGISFICGQYSIGGARDVVFDTGSNYDAADFFAQSNSDTRNWIYWGPTSPNSIVGVGNFGDAIDDVVGATVCNSDGHANQFACGQITSTNTNADYGNGIVIQHSRVSTAYDEPGDSGSGVVGLTSDSSQNVAVGIVNGRQNDSSGNFQYCVYSHIGYVLPDFGVTVLTS
jgi:hypothetical protein